jgi:hypothetical protein
MRKWGYWFDPGGEEGEANYVVDDGSEQGHVKYAFYVFTEKEAQEAVKLLKELEEKAWRYEELSK